MEGEEDIRTDGRGDGCLKKNAFQNPTRIPQGGGGGMMLTNARQRSDQHLASS